MSLDQPRARRLHVAGSTAFPTPFPALGTISIEDATVDDGTGRGCLRRFVVVQSDGDYNHRRTHVIGEEHVVAIFLPKKRRRRDAVDLDKGKWFLFPRIVQTSDGHRILDVGIDPKEIGRALGVKAKRLRRRSSPARGIVFVRSGAPVIHIQEHYGVASSACDSTVAYGCDCDCFYPVCCCDG